MSCDKRVMGLDVGNRRIGIALADESQTIATPLDTVHRSDLLSDLRSIETFLDTHNVSILVIGWPLESDGQMGRQARKVQKFVEALLQRRDGLKYEFWDERMSTRIAQAALIEGKTRRQKRKTLVDKVAASVILQGWLDARKSAFDR